MTSRDPKQSTESDFENVSQHNRNEFGQLNALKIIRQIPILYWFEKLILLIDYFQIFSLYWVAAQVWPWPYIFVYYTRPFLYLNGDYFSTTTNGALAGRSTNNEIPNWGKMNNYQYYGLIFSGVQFLFFIPILVLRNKSFIKFPFRFEIISICLLVSYLIYLPCSLSTFRFYYCESNSDLSADPNIKCGSMEYIIYAGASSVLCLPVFFGLPYMFYKYISDSIIYYNPLDHEKKLQIWEILYMLDMDDYWLESIQWIVASFKRFGSYFRFHMLVFKAILLILFIFIRFDLILQSVLFFTLTTLFCLYYTIFRLPFRSDSSNLILLAIFGLMVTNVTFGMVDAFGVKSAITASSNQSLIMGSVNILGFLFIVVVFLQQSIFEKVLDWPSLKTLSRITSDRSLYPKIAEWVEIIKEARDVKLNFIFTPVEVADVGNLEEYIRRLRICWVEARSMGSLFESPLSDVLEDLLLIHSMHFPAALRKYPHWDKAYQQATEHGGLLERMDKFKTMNPTKRRILLKLLAYRFLRGNRGKFDINIARQYQREKMMLQRKIDSRKGKYSFGDFKKNAFSLLQDNSGKYGVDDSRMPEVVPDDFSFTAREIEEATKMIKKLQERTELALNKHHNVTQKIREQQMAAMANAFAASANSSGILNKINTIDLIKETVDEDEQKDLEELYILWDEAIQLYEIEQFPGDPEELNRTVENWYVYRELISQRLEIVMRALNEKDFDALIDAPLVIEEGEDESEAFDEENQSHPLLSAQA